MKIEVFKTGTQTDSAGNTQEWTTEDLDTMVSLYEAERATGGHEAPVVLGHPVDNSPAYGWVEKFERIGDTLYAYLKDLKPEFVQWVEEKLYKKRSISLYPDLLPRHVGFLGGVPPAVKGLSDIEMAQHKFQAKGSEGFIVEFADGIGSDTPSAAGTEDPAPDVHALQRERSTKFGIQILGDKVSSIEKPAAFADVPDEQFADPVNYRFPLNSPANVKVSFSLWNNWESREKYNEVERQVIMVKIMEAMEANGITREDTWGYYSETLKPQKYERKLADLKNFLDVPAELLSKSQLVKVITGQALQSASTPPQPSTTITGQNNNTPLTNLEESSMDEAQLAQLTADLIKWLGETFGEEVANQTSAKLTELQEAAKAAKPPADGATGEPPVNANESPAFAEAMRKIDHLERINRTNDFEKFCEGLMAGEEPKLLPKQKDNALALLELGHQAPAPVSFSEGDKKVTKPAIELVKSFLNSLEPQANFGEQATGDNAAGKSSADFAGMNVDEDNLELYTKAKDYVAEQGKAGKTVSFKEAVLHISKEGK